jgi:hypothetical protein
MHRCSFAGLEFDGIQTDVFRRITNTCGCIEGYHEARARNVQMSGSPYSQARMSEPMHEDQHDDGFFTNRVILRHGTTVSDAKTGTAFLHVNEPLCIHSAGALLSSP